jgi:hypothetical protein
MAISTIGMQTHVYVCIFLIWTSNYATIILCVYVRFTFKWNVDCMDCILMMWGIRFADNRHHVCQVYKKKNLLLFWLEKPGCYSFPWLFLSQHGLCVLANPWFRSRNSFGDDFRGGSNSVFLDSFCVNRGCVDWRIHASPLKAISGAISEWAAT